MCTTNTERVKHMCTCYLSDGYNIIFLFSGKVHCRVYWWDKTRVKTGEPSCESQCSQQAFICKKM